MFALWYLSLALDELRKYLGWTSIFDIFEKSKTASSKAVDSKPTNLTQPDKGGASELPKKPEPKVPELQPQLPSKRVDRPNVEPVMPTRPAPVQPKPVSPNVPEKQVGPPKFEPKPEPPKSESPKTEPPKAEPPKVETPKVEPPKVETPKVEPPKVETPKIEPPKVETPKVEPPKVEPPKVQTPQPSKPKDKPTNSAFTANTPTNANNAAFFPGGNADQKLFSNSSPKGFENGDHFTDLSKSSTNVKDATSSFLEGEGGANQLKREKR